jgi:predicted transcriptional regulator of viral defense system
VASLESYIAERVARGRAYFSKEEAVEAVGQSPRAFVSAAQRLVRKRVLASPKRGFYIVIRPEDALTGAPDPVRWIDPLMKYMGLDYRVSLLRAAAFHGSSHQAAMLFQLVAPKQLPEVTVGRHKIQFVYQAPAPFSRVNQSEWLDQMKSEAGFAKVAGIELTLLDAARYFHKAGGINGAAQVVHDLGAKAVPRKLAQAAAAYDNSAVRRLGYLLDHFGHERQASVLLAFVKNAKSVKPLDPSVRALVESSESHERNLKWMLTINEAVEIDS